MSAEHPNAVAYRRTADAFRSGDTAALAELLAADVVWSVPGSHPMSGEIHGRDGVMRWLEALGPLGFWLTEDDVFASDDHVCAVSTMGALRGNLDVRTRVISIFHYRDGQQCRRWLYPDDSSAWDQMFTA